MRGTRSPTQRLRQSVRKASCSSSCKELAMRPTDALAHPDDWSTATVRQSVELKRGVSWSKEQEHTQPREGCVPVIGIGNVQETLEVDDLLYLSGLKPAVAASKRVTAGWTV